MFGEDNKSFILKYYSEITINPVEEIGNVHEDVCETQFCQVNL